MALRVTECHEVGVRFWGALAFATLIIAGLSVPASAGGLETLQVVTAGGPHEFQVEIAADDATRERGLINRRYMPADHGMLFEFEREATGRLLDEEHLYPP